MFFRASKYDSNMIRAFLFRLYFRLTVENSTSLLPSDIASHEACHNILKSASQEAFFHCEQCQVKLAVNSDIIGVL